MTISQPLIVLAVIIVAYGAFSGILSRTWLSGPMAFTLAGFGLGAAGLGIIDLHVDNEVLGTFAEVTLGLILFADAASTNSRQLLHDNRIPTRLLVIGLPMIVAAGTLTAHLLFPQLSLTEAALIAAILAPTDAALGYAVVSSNAVPERIRQGILVESGLNDGLALPAVLFFAALAHTLNEAHGVDYWLGFVIGQIGLGAAVGIAGGMIFGSLVHWADGKGWISQKFKNLTALGVALVLLLGAHFIAGNGFIAAFVGGLIYGQFCHHMAGDLTEFVEEEGQLFSLVIFFFFGAIILPGALPYATPMCVFYALLSLTVVRMIPVAIALTGTNLSLAGVAFIGWFGPRGLASILFLFIALGHEQMEHLGQIQAVVYLTVLASIVLHGMSAPFLSHHYGASEAANRDGRPQEQSAKSSPAPS